MIKIEIFRNQAGEIAGFQVRGHSNTAPRGQDIVCAGVSALTQTAVLGMEKHLNRDFTLAIRSSGQLKFDLKDDPDTFTGAILETMLLGLREIAKANPDNVSITEIGR